MADTQAYYSGLLSTLDTKISGMIANPRPNYRVGNVSYAHGDLLDTLMETREKILKRMASHPYESIENLQTAVDEFGQDLNDYENEAFY